MLWTPPTRKHKRVRDDSGLALLDVLLGMAIFALIVIIAIQAIGQFRQRAYQTAVASDARQVGVALETHYSDTQTYPAALDAATLGQMGANLTRNNKVSEYTRSASSVSFCVQHTTGTEGDAYARYDSARGGITASGRGSGCGPAYNPGTDPTVACPRNPSISFEKISGRTAWNVNVSMPAYSGPGTVRYGYGLAGSGSSRSSASPTISEYTEALVSGQTLSYTFYYNVADASGTAAQSAGCDPVSVVVP